MLNNEEVHSLYKLRVRRDAMGAPVAIYKLILPPFLELLRLLCRNSSTTIMASFTLFPKLPLELQDLIWEFYLLGPSPPTAHFARIERDTPNEFRVEEKPDLPTEMLLVYRSGPPSHLNDAYIGFDRGATLLQTTSRSRALTRRLKATQTHPLFPALLLKDPRFSVCCPSLRIDTSTDIIILNNVFNGHLLPGPPPGFDATAWYFRYIAINIPSYHLESKSLKYIIANIKSIYVDSLDVLYVIVDPDVLRQSEGQPWIDSRDLGIMNHRFSLERYLKTYTESKIRPAGFKCGTREYFEVPAEQIPRLGGLSRVIALLDFAGSLRQRPKERILAEKQKAIDRGEIEERSEPIRFRLMTWRE